MISVVITVHPPLLKHLQRCMDSVLWQLNPEDEVIVAGDGCDPVAAYDVRSGYLPYLVKVDRPEDTAGEPYMRNFGIGGARGDWIKFLDADDLLAPFALNAFRAVGPSLPDDVAVLAGAQIKVHNGIVREWVDPVPIDQVIHRQNPTLPSMAFVRRAHALAVGGFDDRLDFECDWDFWLRLRRADYRFSIVRVPFCYYWIDDAERAASETQRTHKVEGMDVRDYFAKTYGISPMR